MSLLNKFLKYRYLIALLAFVIGVSLNLHGSSISNWNKYGMSQTIWNSQSTTQNDFNSDSDKIDIESNFNNWISMPPRADGTLVGVPRMIRTDEWLVQTPFYLSQANSGNQLINPTYEFSGQNMIVAYNAPVKHISVIGKPFNWGFLFLGASRGLSWYWCFKIIGMLLLSFEFGMIITKKNKLLSLLGSAWITFSPSVQWWFMQHLGDVVFFSLLIMVTIYHFLFTASKKKKLLYASLLSSALIGFVLVIYPAFQVPFAYLISAFFLIYFIRAWKMRLLTRFDWIVMLGTLLFSGGIIGYTLWESREAITLTLNTVYPGSRVSVGGELKLHQLIEFLLNIALPFKIPTFSNQVELASSFQFLPLFFLAIPFLIKKDQVKDNTFGLFLVVYTLLLTAYAFITIPELLSKVTLFSFVTSSRAWQTVSVTGVFASIWFLSYIWEMKDKKIWVLLLTMLPSSLLLAYLVVVDRNYISYLDNNEMLKILGLYLVIYLLFIFRSKLAIFSILVLILLSGWTVNPIVRGIGVIENKAISVTIKKIVKQDQNAIWMTENGKLYQLPQMLGAHSIDGVRFYPDLKLMKKLDPKNQFETNWNRYSHLNYILTTEETKMTNPSPDSLSIQLNVKSLDSLEVDYILTNRDLVSLFGSDKFSKVYGADQDGNMIFQYKN
ncbi:MAG: hypothetical protein SOZ69_03030 [Streptococcus sp.]|nr:hypothetical protein [Streptococcus sp.]MDY3823795.1 hypothetical protein [Streptococcus sp.]